jgi:nucleoside-diphosphate-sugar epimerase
MTAPQLTGLRIAVTGASGFIGRRLATLAADQGADILRLGRRGGRGRSAVRLTDEAAVRAAITGCHAVMHCAVDLLDDGANLDMALTLGRVCAAQGIRLVHMSSAAVYEPLPDGVLTEDADTTLPGTAYTAMKRAIERALLVLVAQAGLDVVILQPTIVYGPYGGAWTDGPIRELLTGDVLLPDAGEGLCNPVFVDDVCRAAIAACRAPVASGARILISGPETVSWRRFLGAYAAMLGVAPPQAEPAGMVPDMNDAPAQPPPLPSGSAKQALRKLVLTRLGATGRARVNTAVQRLRRLMLGRVRHQAHGAKRALYQARCRVSTAQATALLAFTPTYTLDAGMAATRDYIRRSYGIRAAPKPAAAIRTRNA